MASFSFTTDAAGDPVVIRARGYLSRIGGEQLEAEVSRLLEAGGRRFEVDLGGTDLINSVGVSILIGVIERVRGAGGAVAFTGLTQVNEEIFRIMGLHRHARLARAAAAAGEGGR